LKRIKPTLPWISVRIQVYVVIGDLPFWSYRISPGRRL
jgi:hypothetical protein